MTQAYRSLPSVEAVLSDGRMKQLCEVYSRQSVLTLVRGELDEVRRSIRDGNSPPNYDELIQGLQRQALNRWRTWPEHVINATGVILHTNLGRAPLSQEAIMASNVAAAGYTDLELDLQSGTRGSRQAHVATLLTELTGAEAAYVVNNNASAVMLGLAAIAHGKEVIVSRGEAVEIGGGFRIPDVLGQSGATLVEVGTTNRTYARDYEAAITEKTGAIMAVHASNFRVMGFTHTPKIAELVALGTKYNVPVIHDIGSGCLLDTTQFGLEHEPMPQTSVSDGVSLGFFSGDKLLGGPQAGIIVGTSELVGVISRHPLARAVRIDKMSMAALSATLLHYIKGEALEKIPIWRMMAMSEDELKSIATRWADAAGESADVARAESTIGGGSLPGETLDSWVVRIEGKGTGDSAEALAARLRSSSPAVVGRIEDDRVLLDPRTVLPEEEDSLLRVLGQVVERSG